MDSRFRTFHSRQIVIWIEVKDAGTNYILYLDEFWRSSWVLSFTIRSGGVVFSVRDSAFLFSTMTHQWYIPIQLSYTLFTDFSLISLIIVSLDTLSLIILSFIILSRIKKMRILYGLYIIVNSVDMSFTWLHSSHKHIGPFWPSYYS